MVLKNRYIVEEDKRIGGSENVHPVTDNMDPTKTLVVKYFYKHCNYKRECIYYKMVQDQIQQEINRLVEGDNQHKPLLPNLVNCTIQQKITIFEDIRKDKQVPMIEAHGETITKKWVLQKYLDQYESSEQTNIIQDTTAYKVVPQPDGRSKVYKKLCK